jgi:alpha-tubulin suppressor-like RCC1 family protein/uncharacterized protein YjdB
MLKKLLYSLLFSLVLSACGGEGSKKDPENLIVLSNIVKSYGDNTFKIEVSGGRGGDLQFTTNQSKIASVDFKSGMVTLHSLGVATIAIKESADQNYAEKVTFVTITVNQAQPDDDGFSTLQLLNANFVYGQHNTQIEYAGGNKGALHFHSSNVDVATIDSSTGEISVVSAGTTTITITEAETANFASQSKEAELRVTSASTNDDVFSRLQTEVLSVPFGQANFLFKYSGGNGGQISFSSSNTRIAEIDPLTGEITILGVGVSTISVKEGQTNNFTAQQVDTNITITQSQAGHFSYNTLLTNSKSISFGEPSFDWLYKGGNQGVISYTSSNLNVATVDDNGVIDIFGVGTTVITVNESATPEFSAQSSSATLNVNQAVFGSFAYSPLTTHDIDSAYGDNNFIVTYTGGNAGTTHFILADTTIADIDYNTAEVTLNGVGQTTVTIIEDETPEFAGQTLTISLSVSQAQLGDTGFTQLVTSDISKAYGDKDFLASYSGSNSTPITFSSSDPFVATIDEDTGKITILKKGTTTLTLVEGATPEFAEQQATYNLSIYRTRVTALASTYWQFAAIRDDGSAISWGNSEETTPTNDSVNGKNDVLSIVGNIYSFAAIHEDGSVTAWGSPSWAGGSIDNTNNQLNGDIDVLSISAIWAGFAAIRKDGSVVNWGYIADGVVIPVNDLDGSVDVVSITSNQYSYAALRIDGSVITWGVANAGGDSSSVASQIDGSIKVTAVYSTDNTGTDNAYAAIREDGSVITWGESTRGGDSAIVAAEINGANPVIDIASNHYALSAIRQDGSVISWGDQSFGGDNSAVAAQIDGTIPVVSIASAQASFAALRDDGSVVTWGAESPGSKAVDLDGTVDVVALYSSVSNTFAALREDGKVIAWGGLAGNTAAVDADLDGTIKVVSITVSRSSFAALREDGSVITWGSTDEGGDSSAVGSQINGTVPVIKVYSATQAFAALRNDGSVITWGNSNDGGDSASVANKIIGNPMLELGFDTDRDGISNDLEWSNCTVPYPLKTGSQPCLGIGDVDSDNDGVWDYFEVINGSDPQLNTIEHTMGDLNFDGYPDYWQLPGINTPVFN